MTQPMSNVEVGLYEPYDYEDLTVDSTAGGVALDSTKVHPAAGQSNVLKGAQRVTLTLETASVRYTTDTTAPTSTKGHLMNAGDILTLLGQPAIDNFRAIRTGATSGTFRITYER